MPKFQHFVLTAFNIWRKGFKRQDKHGNPILTDEWMEHRVMLFEKFCFPSMKNQSNLNFRWLVSFADETPAKYRRFIDAYCTFSNFTPIFSPTGFRMAITKCLDKDTEYLITTRLDNDDAFHRDAVSRIQQSFSCQNFEFLNFPLGYQLTYPGNETFLRRDVKGPFVSLVETVMNRPVKTVRRWDHTKLREIGPMRHLDFAPYWLQVIHDRNMVNRVGGAPISPPNWKESFGIQIEQ